MINMDSFGTICPTNWEEIAAWLNAKIHDALQDLGDDTYMPGYSNSGLSPDAEEIVDQIWETWCSGGYPDCPEAVYDA